MQRSLALTRVARILVVAGALALPAAALASSSSSPWVSACTKEAYKPKQVISLTCNGAPYLKKMKWSSWSARQARGSGGLVNNNCTPSCAAGKETTYSVTVVLSKPIKCRNQKHKVFNKAAVTFTHKRPEGYNKTTTFKLKCPF